MKSIVTFLGVAACCLVTGAWANAKPLPLADADLDHVTAGVIGLAPSEFGSRFRLGPIPPDDRLYCAAIGCRPGEPGYPNPGGPIPVEPPGCETGACGSPGLAPPPRLAPISPIGSLPLGPVRPLFQPSPGEYCGPACDPGPVDLVPGG